MGDFYQNGIVTTLHNLVRRPVEDIEADLLQFRKARPMSLVLPSLYSELEGPALKHIVQELAKVPYVVVVGDKEMASSEVSVRARHGQDLGSLTKDALLEMLASEVARKGRGEAG